ncbi:MAG: glycoside hydrolase [Blautia marasmi]
MKDAGQLWMLEQANAYRKAYAEETGQENDVINKVFSNSPPYYMTKSGTSTGGTGWDPNNLKDDCYDDFAMYLARATEWVDKNLESKYGAGVSYVEPLNEPDTSYWYEGRPNRKAVYLIQGTAVQSLP